MVDMFESLPKYVANFVLGFSLAAPNFCRLIAENFDAKGSIAGKCDPIRL
jgi:hypothetical protein